MKRTLNRIALYGSLAVVSSGSAFAQSVNYNPIIRDAATGEITVNYAVIAGLVATVVLGAVAASYSFKVIPLASKWAWSLISRK